MYVFMCENKDDDDDESSSSLGGNRCQTNVPVCVADGDHRASERAGRAVERSSCRTY